MGVPMGGLGPPSLRHCRRHCRCWHRSVTTGRRCVDIDVLTSSCSSCSLSPVVRKLTKDLTSRMSLFNQMLTPLVAFKMLSKQHRFEKL